MAVIWNLSDLFFQEGKSQHNDAFASPESAPKPQTQVISSTASSPQNQPTASNGLDQSSIALLLSKASVSHGKSLSAKCAMCHTFDKGGPNRVGPNLWNIVGSKKAHLGTSFSYSKSMLAAGGEWTYQDLFSFIKKPNEFIKGTRMVFVGISNNSDIADLVAFLRSNSDNPTPLPETTK